LIELYNHLPVLYERPKMNKVIFYDFHNTLAYRHKYFTTSVILVLDRYERGHAISHEHLLPYLQTGFPWLEPDKEYHHLKDPQKWWENIYPVFINALKAVNFSTEKAEFYTKEARKIMTGPGYYTLFDDTLDSLKRAKEYGYRNIILSNHVPELPLMAEQLGLMKYVDICISSANVGYEKPNIKIYELALKIADYPLNPWMIGDNYIADYQGARTAGIKSILVRKSVDEKVELYSDDLKGALDIILK